MGMPPQGETPQPAAHDGCDDPVHDWIDIRAARRLVLEKARPLTRRERVPIVEATGRRLAQEVRGDSDLPPFDRVMMDGFAVRAADVVGATAERPVELPVVGEVAAGAAGDEPLEPGQARSIMTGAPLSPGADAVIQHEWTHPAEGRPDVVCIERPVVAGQNVAPRGEDLRAGDVIARPDELVGPLGLSLLVSSGAAEVDVLARPRVAVLTSGDELVPPGAPIRRGQIRESNGPALADLFRRCGAEVDALGVAKDTKEDLAALLERALEADIVVLTGGSSVGRYDFSAEVVESFGATRHFQKLSVKPGKPTLFYTRGETLVFCLPGNPVAALMTGRVLVCPAVRRLAGDDVAVWPDHEQPLSSPVKRNPVRDLLVPVRRHDGQLAFEGWHGSGDLVCMSRADAFAFVAAGQGSAEVGSPATVFPLVGQGGAPAGDVW